MPQELYGYIRVSSRDQNESRQVRALIDYGVPTERLIVDRQSGKDFDRPGYRRLLKRLRAGDTLAVKSIDRLGRNYNEILEQWRFLTKTKRVEVVVLDMPLLDTRTGHDLTGTLIADIVLQLLSYVAETERELIRQRQREGIITAHERGVKFGRPRRERPEAYEEIKPRVLCGELSQRAAAKLLGVPHTTFRRWLAADSDMCNFD